MFFEEMEVVDLCHSTQSAIYCLAYMNDDSADVCRGKQRMDATLQDVHPDKLCSLRTTADLVFEEILRLERSKQKHLKHDATSFSQPNLVAVD